MSDIDLTPVHQAARDAIWRHATRDVTGSIDRPTADRLATRAVRAATPLLREQIARDIESYADATWDLIDSPNGARLAFVEVARIARGEQP